MYDWNSQLPDVNGFEILPEGDYYFRVVTAEKRVWERGKLTGACYMKLGLELWKGGQTGEASANLTLHPKTIFAVRNFWKSVGEKVEDGKPLMVDWDSIIGRKGKCHVSLNEYQKRDGTMAKANNVENWLELKPGENMEPPPNQDEGDGTGFGGDLPF